MIDEDEDWDKQIAKYSSQATVIDKLTKVGENKGELCVLMDLIDVGEIQRAITFARKLKKECNHEIAMDGYQKLITHLEKKLKSQD
jgi:hypothetical protein